MSNTADNKSLTPSQKIVLFAFVSYLVQLPKYIGKLIDINTGLGEIMYTLVYFAFPLALYVIHQKYWKQSLRFPHLIPFLLMVLVFLLFQELLSPSVEGAPYNGYAHFFIYQIRIYIFFLMLVNFGLNRVTFYKVIDYALYSVLLICLITYVGYLGFFEIDSYGNVGSDIINTSLYQGTRTGHVLQVNNMSDLLAFAILLLIIKQRNEKRFSKAYLFRDFTVILMTLGMITINATRGATLIAVIIVFYYIYFLVYSLWRQWIRDKNAKMFISIFLIFVFALVMFRTANVLEKLKSSESQIALISQFQSLQRQWDEKAGSLRIVNMMNSWRNFLDHPFTGVGYYSAAKRYGIGTRSNNQYTQLLASYGIIFFIIYIYYNFRLVVFRFSLLKRPEVVLCLVYHAMLLLFRKPLERVAILAYIAVFFYYNSKSIHSNSKI